MKRHRTTVGLVAVLVLPVLNARSADIWSSSPTNPAFQAYLDARTDAAQAAFDAAQSPAGLIPSPILIPPGQVRPMGASEPLPPSFDLRTEGGLTPIRNQGLYCGSCWAFATYGSLESFLKYSKKKSWNFSEQHLNQTHGFDSPECGGGTFLMATAYLTRGGGPLTESVVPYPYDKNASIPTVMASAYPLESPVKAITNVRFLPKPVNPLANDAIKRMVKEGGAVTVDINMKSLKEPKEGEEEDLYFFTSKCPDTGACADHSVAIVGWDNDFPKAKFEKVGQPAPEGNGAYVIRNSWGKKSGDKGYYYLSYYDVSISNITAYHDAHRPSRFDQIYQYDPLGWTKSMGVESAEPQTAWFSNVFTASADASYITQVAFYTPTAGSRYNVFVYDKVNQKLRPTLGIEVANVSGELDLPGYHSVKLKTQPKVTANKAFSIVVQLTTPKYKYPVPIEQRVDGYSSAANAAQYQSFVSADGKEWKDVTQIKYILPDDPHKTNVRPYQYANVALKAYAAREPD